MKVSLVIPTYNRENFLIDTLKCAFDQHFDDYEIIVVDQTEKHTPETISFLEANKTRFIYITLEKPSLTVARNTGVKASKGEVVIMVDDDTLFERDFIHEHWTAHQNGHDVVSGRVDEGKPKIAAQPIWLNKWFQYKGSENCMHDGKTNKFAGCNGSFKRKVYDSLGGFDENYYGKSICEDTDFGYRAYNAGYDVYFKASAGIFHRRAVDGGVQNRIKNLKLDQSYYFCLFYFIKKNLPPYALIFRRFRFYLKAFKATIKMLRNAEKEVDNCITQKDALKS
jgi:glycosyltransferase involved in cell wall biosynthesis